MPYARTAQNKSVTSSCVRNFLFFLFPERGWQGAVFKVMKNDHFLVFLAVWILFSKFLGR